MSSTPQLTSTARAANAWTGPLQTALAAVAVCVLYWAVGINDSSASATSRGVHLQQVGSTTSGPSGTSAVHFASRQVR
ncbi:hypothetical protein ABEG17_12675 [Pedococcus sp. KACC 23699]|uniref:Uncharacterized protein n=1 Tax=Pedococcus sp. KACC 23699 TaxID=3149228 RepID=A0AAU7JQC9_9MICO